MPAAAVFCRKGNVRVAKRIVFGFIYFSAHIQSAFKKIQRVQNTRQMQIKLFLTLKLQENLNLVHVELFSTHIKAMLKMKAHHASYRQ